MAIKPTKEEQIKKEQIQKICLVSSAALNAATCVWSWTAPIGAVLGLFASIDTNKRKVLEKEFRHAVDAALNKTREDLTTENSIKIIDELASMVVRPDNINELISNCETYRSSYCTPLDRKRIVDIFEMYFKEEVCKCAELSNQYLLTAGTLTLEKIKNINDVLIKQGENLTIIKDGVDELNDKTDRIIDKVDKIFAVTKTLLGECGFILVSVAGCLILGSVLAVSTPLFYLHVIVSYAIASLLSNSMLTQKNKSIFKLLLGKQRNYEQFTSSFLMLIFIYPVISVGVYMVIVSSQLSGALDMAVLREIECMLFGGVAYGTCKGIYIRMDNHSTEEACNDVVNTLE